MKITVSDSRRRYVRDRLEDHMTGTVKIVRLMDNELDDYTGRIMMRVDPNYTGYEGKARIWEAENQIGVQIGDTDFVTSNTFISVPHDADPVPEVNEFVMVLAYPDDTSLIGRMYRITNVNAAGLYRPTRRLVVIAETRNWDY